MIARVCAAVLLIAAVAAGGAEAMRSFAAGAYEPLSAGEAWYAIHRGSLNLVQAVIQRYLLAELWDWIFLPLLSLPLWVVLGVPGLALLWAARPRQRGRFLPRRRS